MLACGGEPPTPVPSVAAPAGPTAAGPTAAGPAAAAVQAARSAPTAVAPWSGPWQARVFGTGPGARALAQALGSGAAKAGAPDAGAAAQVGPHPLSGGRPVVPAGTVALVWIEAGADPAATARSLGPAPGSPPGGAVVAVLDGGGADWRARMAAALPWAGLGVLDPTAELERYLAPASASTVDPRVRATMAARVLADRHGLPWTPLDQPLPPGLAQVLGPFDVADLDSADARVRAEALRRAQDDPRLQVPVAVDARSEQVAVRLVAAAGPSGAGPSGAGLVADPDPQVRARAMESASAPQAAAGLEDPSSVVRVVAAHRLGVLARQGEDVAEALRGAAASPDAYVRWKAAWGLAAVAGGAPPLMALLDDRDADVRRQAARSLGQLGRAEAVERLQRALADDNSFVRRWAAEALGRIGDPAAIPALERAAQEPTVLVAAAAHGALRALGATAPPPAEYRPPPPPADAAAVQAEARHPDATRRKDLCKFLAGDARHQALLEQLAVDVDSEVRKTAVEALGWLDGAVQPLRRAVQDEDPDVIVTALQGLTRQGAGDQPEVLARLSDPDAEIRLRAAQALAAAATRGADADAALKGLAGDPDERIRAAAVGAFPALLAAEEASVLVRRAAVAAPDGALPDGALPDSDLLVQAAAPGADPDLAAWARGVIAREDDLLHHRFSWNDDQDRPDAYDSLRPPVIRAYGFPDRG